jgi:hypothetical protein
MLFPRFSPALPLAACALVMGLSGCAAVPLAQLAVTQMAPKPCLPGSSGEPGAPAGAYGDLSKGVSDSFRKLTTLVSDSQPVTPAK